MKLLKTNTKIQYLSIKIIKLKKNRFNQLKLIIDKTNKI